ncbi:MULTISPECIES: ammonium transporter [unclassified Rhodococcus (in: high G+C Gram-positive bacteria)]|uniref:ammonium transporter n=1 Tax=unclassified Rhodococcus (in: high G+C Gram-positive bacteria) TaxID=192944 RepID=UPI001C9AB162|nr:MULTISPECIES: ammonium transporter [unclassified Rhodococcus (in: high G+C Gram-positive bacteria)]MBY6686492.1 ammonium transporter [Rhodococcus sp. BP-288]MBY6695202.1 ammonium transporter [Rhodococcus sp. BP-188]MBY6699984.1 ammonium transporter [Rhodococcus sp. BP-285]MBY6704993.1 ammonium transporter [Rhodococcus sp. BP-283]MBY6713109.1 ammonium transporter [Rhodococcus sp. BP-160]
MTLRRLVATSAIAIASLGVATGTAYAQPATTTPSATTTESAPAENSELNWASRVEAGGVVTTVDAGMFRASDDGKAVVLEDEEGNDVLSLPLSFNLNGIEFPYGVEYTDEGRTVKLIPNLAAPMGLTPVSLEQNAASPAENLKAQDNFASQLGLASAVGGLTGTIIGAGLGAIGFVAGPLGVLTIPSGATLGGIIGTIVVGGPTLAIAGVDFVNTLLAPPGTTQWAN